ncbi:TetR/AcrR family transcriptional regulator [Streptosporangium sp. NBC_01755]|uniref:TetR/AcrR family transcriptional regulator n=1 Tax=unclassified Streptosporangium TaxID=2632669 RepID=UPI002DDC436D|nr:MULTISPECIES: TetR/AcrR family transcriptional regulator [unclassified Streptosporangium]WSA25037.1 TetR/AcrR family transcriptional regulator [Streptosporangium sp. NBC_01810]WSD03632.1 TetR/AcrR family transcriptional regulator [Streptosporangium sp. NBC_01755]
MIPSDDPRSQAVIDIAMRLFAAFGYDGTSLHDIAEAAGTNLAWLQQRFGDKYELYLTVIDHSSRMERGIVEDVLGALPASDSAGVRAVVRRLPERYLELFLTNPRIPALWAHRWLGDAADIPDLEETYKDPIIDLICDALRPAAQAGLIDDRVNLKLTVQTLIWSVYGFMHGEAVADANHSLAADPQAQQRFLSHLHQLVDRMLTPRDG